MTERDLATSEPSLVKEFAVRCADGHVIDEEPWDEVENADRDAALWDTDCDCNGPHEVLVRTITTSGWEPIDA